MIAIKSAINNKIPRAIAAISPTDKIPSETNIFHILLLLKNEFC